MTKSDDKKVDKISRILLQIGNNLIVKIHCRLSKEVNGITRSFHNFFSYGDLTYLSLEHNVYITLEIKNELTAWSKDQSIMITTKNIHQLLQSLKYMINLCKGNNNIYYYTTQSDGRDKITVLDNVVKEHIMQIKLLGDEMPRILMYPSVKMDTYDIYNEAIRIHFNRNDIYTDITIDEAESLYYNLSKVDFFQYGMMMIQYYVSSIESNKVTFNEEKRNIPSYNKTKVIFNTKQPEKVQSILEKDKSDREFFDL